MKLGIFIGSFNPVQKAHIKIIKHLILKKYIDKVLIVPTGNYWHKQNLINISDRINMLKIFENDKIKIDEVNNNEEYTYLLLRKLQKQYPNDELYLIIGADNIVKFNEWKNYEELLQYNIIIINRDNINVAYYLNKLNKKDKFHIVKTLGNMDVSSTTVRNLLKENNIAGLDKLIYKKVLNYIINKKLYN